MNIPSEGQWWLQGAALAALLCFVLAPLAGRVGWLDLPSPRKDHRRPTPLVGGAAIFLAYFPTLGLAAAWGMATAPSPMLLGGCAIALLTGLADDRWPLNAGLRFLAQALACVLMVYGAGVVLQDFGELFWPATLSLGWLAVPVTVFAALGVINAFNMIDGLDGVAGSVFAVSCAAMALLSSLSGQHEEAFLLILAMSCTLGFLALNARFPWNRRARIFLGDSGTLFLGFFLAWMFIDLGNGHGRTQPAAFAPMTAVWIFGLPLMDTTRLMRNRWKAGRSAFRADRQHLHHAFLAAGFSVRATWLAITGLSIAFAAVGIGFELTGTPHWISFYSFVALGFAYLRIMQRTWDRLDSGIFAAQAMAIRK
jgi:undecaprenyl-phosphate alpha-N-acetylglucosaminyl 1-phosphatetransferase